MTGNYWDYPTSTDVIPYSDNPLSLNTPDNTNVANFFKDDGIENGYDGGWAVTGITSRDPGLNYLTDVGAYSLAVSPYGTYDQGGSLWEWNELSDSLESRGLRGGDWGDLHFDLLSTLRNGFIPSTENSVYGFRIAGAIPEPQSVLLGFCFTCFIFAWGRSLTARRRSTGR